MVFLYIFVYFRLIKYFYLIQVHGFYLEMDKFPIMFDLKPYIMLIWKNRWFLSANFIVVGVASVIFAFYIVPQEFSSQVTFLPPSNNMGSLFNMSSNPLMSLFSSDESGDMVETIFDSKIMKRRIIDKFNLYENYKLTDNANKFENAVKQMRKQVMLGSVLKGKGIGMSKTVAYTIVCYHTSPDTALLMAQYVYACLDSAIINISIGKASSNREFIESQFIAAHEKLDSLQLEFKEFQLAHKAFDISEQMKITLNAYADIKSASMMNDLRLAALRRQYAGNTPEIIEAMNLKRDYDRKLTELEQKNAHEVMPSLNMASELMPAYLNLYRSLEVQNQIILLLTKELEQARLQEARDISPLVLIDPPYIAEYKARPKRIPMVFTITAAYISFLMFIIIAHKLVADFYRLWFVKPRASTIVNVGAREQEQHTGK